RRARARALRPRRARRAAAPDVRGDSGQEGRLTRPARGLSFTTMATSTKRRWSQRVNQTSDALDLEKDVFKQRSPRAIAASLKRSADRSRRRKAGPFRSAMSMLSFYINRAGKKLSPTRKKVLESAKGELRKAFKH